MDEIVRLISFIWAGGLNDGVLLDSKDLLKGDVIRRMAGDIASSWMVMKPWLEAGAEVFRKRRLVNIRAHSTP
ncbi:MAG: hypothetical protein IPJ34_40930 [Myxococcales bacterium]|nr:hypothetical protein [Myxococcales bacterium]